MMLYRRKLLLAMVELCGGSVSIAECQAYLARFCECRKKNYYDFFLSQDGYYSFVLAYDKHRLMDLGFFEVQETLRLNQTCSYPDQIHPEDRQLLQTIIAEPAAKQYLDLFADHFYREEAFSKWSQEAQSAKERSRTDSCLFTLGYEGLSIDAYLGLLITHCITFLVDVRKNPFSRKYGFSKKQLLQATTLAGIEYRHLPVLGIPSEMRRHLNSEHAYRELFEHYEQHILPEQQDAIEQIKGLLANAGRIALTCFEADPRFCHRHKITEYLLQSDSTFHTPIIHLKTEKAMRSNNISYVKRKDVPGQASQNSIYIPI